jgi:hypothetical protein
MYKRIAECLGWKVDDLYTFSLPTLREMVRNVGNEKLVEEINLVLLNGSYIGNYESRRCY